MKTVNSPESEADRPHTGLFDELPPDQRQKAEEWFTRYVNLVARIYARLERDPDAYAQFEALTDEFYGRTIPEEGLASQTSSDQSSQ